jgi:hypothetical protein
MNKKNISKKLKWKLDDWLKSIDDKNIVKLIKKNAIITGGALVSLLNNEAPNDYDVYFKNKDDLKLICEYYANIWNINHNENKVEIIESDNDSIQCFIKSKGIATDEENNIDDISEPIIQITDNEKKEEKPKYYPRYFTTNAISLSDKIQLVIRFYGDVSEIHKNYDFVHCTCSYDYDNNIIELPARALEAIINKELFYCGSKYPLCSIIRTRKFIAKGWSINAGQYLKMCLQLNDLNLKDLNVFKDQLVGVDSAYFDKVIDYLIDKQKENQNFVFDTLYIIEIINRIF